MAKTLLAKLLNPSNIVTAIKSLVPNIIAGTTTVLFFLLAAFALKKSVILGLILYLLGGIVYLLVWGGSARLLLGWR